MHVVFKDGSCSQASEYLYGMVARAMKPSVVKRVDFSPRNDTSIQGARLFVDGEEVEDIRTWAEDRHCQRISDKHTQQLQAPPVRALAGVS